MVYKNIEVPVCLSTTIKGDNGIFYEFNRMVLGPMLPEKHIPFIYMLTESDRLTDSENVICFEQTDDGLSLIENSENFDRLKDYIHYKDNKHIWVLSNRHTEDRNYILHNLSLPQRIIFGKKDKDNG
jgi:hypothetical protein